MPCDCGDTWFEPQNDQLIFLLTATENHPLLIVVKDEFRW